jgi:DNA-directed RNA polymerase specialized sigma24 family protein
MPPFIPDEMPTVASKPHRSLWEAALVGHREAFRELADRCGQCVYAWLRANGATLEDAGKRTEHFFTRLLNLEPPNPDEEDVERFQEFVQRRLTAYAEAGFPEAGAERLDWRPDFDHAQAERRYLREAQRAPDDVFTRRWALGTLELTIETLREEFSQDGKAALVPHLQKFLSFSGGEERYAEVAAATGTSVSALHVAVFRYRQRYREILRRLVGDTVRQEQEVDSELTKLLVSAS